MVVLFRDQESTSCAFGCENNKAFEITWDNQKVLGSFYGVPYLKKTFVPSFIFSSAILNDKCLQYDQYGGSLYNLGL